jgi:ABC-type protease/lipase transport system fused ATPase/permease subunit
MGKTTFSRLVSGLIVPRAGKIRLGDVDVSRLQQHSARRDIGHLPQEVTLFQGSVRENIARMARGNLRRVIRAARLAGIHDAILKLPHGYDTEIEENEPLLSGGQRKGIAIARAYYGVPPLIVMDEPTPHLDESARSALFTAISRLKRKGTIFVLTTQSDELSGIADKVMFFRGTKVEMLETREEITAHGHTNGVRSIRSVSSPETGAKSATSIETRASSRESSRLA